jgi:hypothetical protein
MNRLPKSLPALILAALCATAVHAQITATPPAEAPRAKPVPGQPADPKIVESIFTCLSQGLPKEWKKTWFVIRQTGSDASGATREFEADFFVATSMSDAKGAPLVPCGSAPVLEGVTALNDYLLPSQRRWTGATFTFTSEGKFDAAYDYTPRKPAAAAPAAAPAAKPAAKAAAKPAATPAAR